MTDSVEQRVIDYFNSSAINNSLLNLCFNPKWLEFKLNNQDLEDVEKQHFRVGQAIDELLTNPNVFNNHFYVWTHSRPGGLMARFIEALPSDLFILDEQEQQMAYDLAYQTSGYKKSKSSVIAAFEQSDSFKSYFNAKNIAQGKKILSTEDLVQVENAVSSLNIVDEAKQYFSAFNRNPNIEILHQVPIYFYFKGLKMKCLLDGVKIDHENKKIVPFDLKSIGKSVYEFEDSLFQFGYYRQFSFYQYAIMTAIKTQIWPFEDPKYKDYELSTFEAIVVPKKDEGYPALIYEIDTSILKLGAMGGEYRDRKYKGFFELVDNFIYHTSTRDYRAPKWVIDSNFKLRLSINNEMKEEEKK